MPFTVESITNLYYKTEDKRLINCMVKFAEFNEVHPFTASANDPEEHGVNIYNDIVSGKYGPIADYVAPVVSPSQLWIQIRLQRDALMAASDYTQMPDYNASNKAAWATYRQALRDLPQTQTDPANITWPTKPT